MLEQRQCPGKRVYTCIQHVWERGQSGGSGGGAKAWGGGKLCVWSWELLAGFFA